MFFLGGGTKRTPVVLQQTSMECGAACVAMILGYYGRPTQLKECREKISIGRDGVSAASIKELAQSFGLSVSAYTIKDTLPLKNLSEPAIIHWRFNHFVILESISDQSAQIIDPAIGRKVIPLQQFEESFTGILLSFSKLGPLLPKSQHSLTLFQYLRHGLKEQGLISSGLQLLFASIMIQMIGLLPPLATKLLIDNFSLWQAERMLIIFLILIAIIGIGQFLLSTIRLSVLAALRIKFDSALMRGFVQHLLKLPFIFFEHRRTGDLLLRLNSHTALREALTNQALSAVLGISLIIGYLTIISVVSPLLGTLLGGFFIIQIILFKASFQRLYQLGLKEIELQGHTESESIQLLQGIGLIKAMGVEAQSFERWQHRFFRERNAGLEKDRFLVFVDSSYSALSVIGPLLFLWLGGWLVLQEQLTLGDMLALSVMATTTIFNLDSLIDGAQQWISVRAHVDRLLDVVSAEQEQFGNIEATDLYNQPLIFNKVSFQYGQSSTKILNNISLTIAPRKSIAIVGKSGSGKTTLLKLILGLYEPTSGTINWGNINISDVQLHQMRQQMGVIMQDSLLFSGTIADNIAYGSPASDSEQIKMAAKVAEIHDEIVAMPMGYETLLGEQGSGLSGGQKQRIAIARALIRQPRLLVLDEGTSHLDSIVEAKIVDNLNTLSMTRVFVAHRLSTVRKADLIIVMSDGGIVEEGSHQQLMQMAGHYKHLIQQQMNTSD